MRIQPLQIWALLLLLCVCPARATVFYVDVNSTNPTPPYADWSTAATDIQSAVDVSTNGDLVLVTNGVYQTGSRVSPDGGTSRVVVTNAITLQSVNGLAVTAIDGGHLVRCLYLGPGAVFAGFTLTNGNAADGSLHGGGAYCGSSFSTNELIANCLIISNSSFYGGGVIYGTVSNCIITLNRSGGSGGGTESVVAYNCILSNNFATLDGGGASGGISTLNNCLLIGNVSQSEGGGAFGSTLNNCLVISNTTVLGQGGGASGCILNNCTVVGNSGGGVITGSGGYPGFTPRANNCVIYYNYNSSINSLTAITNCCTTPALSGSNGNFTNAPLFVNPAAGDFHLQSNSPCINAGKNSMVTTTVDLDANPRIVGGTVDVGAYEYQTPSSVLSYVWAQQYGLPTDGSADYADTDHTGMDNWQKWIAGLNPTNAASVLAMLPPVIPVSASGVKVSWQSVSNRTYYLQRATDLTAQPAFSTVQSNLAGKAGSTSFTDTTATNGGAYFYRIGVQ